MFYIAKLFINTNDILCPIQNSGIMDYSYENYSDAFEHFQTFSFRSHHILFESPELPHNVVTDYSVDIFNEYYHIHLIINADSYLDCDDVLAAWTLDYLNDILKERWLEDRMNGLPVWYAVVGKEASDAPIDILHIEFIDRSDVPICEIEWMIDGRYDYIPTELSHIIIARKPKPNDDSVEYYGLVIQAEDENKVKEVCKDFIRLYVNEHK